MPNGEKYAHIDSELGNGSRIKIMSNGTWEFVDEEPGFGGWIQRNGNQFLLGVITSIIAGVVIYHIFKTKM